MSKKEIIKLLEKNLSNSADGIRIFRKYETLNGGDYPVATVNAIINLITNYEK